MRRRDFIATLGGAAAAWPLVARAALASEASAQRGDSKVRALASEASGPRGDSKVARIGVLLPGTAASFALRTKAFLDGLRELGYVEGQTIAIEWRWARTESRGLRSSPPTSRGAMSTS